MTGRTFQSTLSLLGICRTVLGQLMGNIAMQCPQNSGSLYHKYKGWFSIVLLAVCDASYNFTLVDIGQYGSTNDSSVLNNSEMGKAFENGSMLLPEPEHLLGCSLPLVPYFLVGDEMFAYKPDCCVLILGRILKKTKVY